MWRCCPTAEPPLGPRGDRGPAVRRQRAGRRPRRRRGGDGLHRLPHPRATASAGSWCCDRGMTPRQAGRMVQRLLEIDTYRMLALLALPLARELAPILTAAEQELAQIATALADARRGGRAGAARPADPAGGGDRAPSGPDAISASAPPRAYHELVQRRIAELREERIQGLQTFREFTERRLAPAMNTCRAVAARQESACPSAWRGRRSCSRPGSTSRRERQNQARAGIDEPARQAAAPPAADRRGPLGRGDHLLCRRAWSATPPRALKAAGRHGSIPEVGDGA